MMVIAANVNGPAEYRDAVFLFFFFYIRYSNAAPMRSVDTRFAATLLMMLISPRLFRRLPSPLITISPRLRHYFADD